MLFNSCCNRTSNSSRNNNGCPQFCNPQFCIVVRHGNCCCNQQNRRKKEEFARENNNSCGCDCCR